MREILFRGKRLDNGEWVEGCGIIATENWASIFTVTDDLEEYSSEVEEFEVIPETVGQYTGLSDKNGVKIFEGDILTYKDKLYEVKYSAEQARFIACLNNGVFDPVAIKNGVVVGNIHDDPELMGGDTE